MARQRRKSARAGLSVSMIVKDEEKHLERCLESIKGIADEIVIVDTGSTDGTVEIAKRYTDKVFFHSWEDSFSKARNQSLGYCTMDWVLSIDADEELVQQDIPLLRRTIAWLDRHPEQNVALLQVLSRVPQGVLRGRLPRLFRRKVARWKGIVHNQLDAPPTWSVSEVRLLHHGYNLAEHEMAKKRERTEKLLGIQIAQDPLNAVAWMELIHSWRLSEQWDKVIGNADRVLKSDRAKLVSRQTTAHDLMCALHHDHEWEQAVQVGLTALEEWPENLDIIMALGLFYRDMGETEKAIEQLEQFLIGDAKERLGQGPMSIVVRNSFSMAPRIRAILQQLQAETSLAVQQPA